MPSVILKAHWRADEPFELPVNASLMVTVFPSSIERSEWAALSAWSLGRAYGGDEPEYTIADMIEGDVVLTPVSKKINSNIK